MSFRGPGILLLATLLALSGCSGGPGGAPTSTPIPSPTSTPTPPSTPTPTAATSAGGTVTGATPSAAGVTTPPAVSPAASATSNAVAYVDLSPRAQRAFDAARDGTVVLGPESRYLDGVDFGWRVRDEFEAAGGRTRYVVRNGTRYAAVLSVGPGVAQYVIETERVDGDAVDDVTAHDDLPANVSAEVRWAVDNGSYATPWGEWYSLPAPLADTEYVRYDGQVYELTYVVGDARLVELRVRPA